MPYSLEFEIEGLPKMSNELLRGHWRQKAAYAKQWKWKVGSALALAGRPPQPLVSAALTLTRYSAMEPDFDGLVSGFKHVIDGLVEFGVLVGDKSSNVGQPKYKWEKAPARKGKIRVRVDEMPGVTKVEGSNEEEEG